MTPQQSIGTDVRHTCEILSRAVLAFASLGGCATLNPAPRIPAGAGYVAMGSSFAAGPGVTTSADQPPNRCARSNDNYAHLLARKLGLQLTDVSCSGATTAHLLGRWRELAPQLDALKPDTRLVTVTIGGNDVGYIGTLGSASCHSFASPPPGTPNGKCPDAPVNAADAWVKLDTAMRRIVAEVHRRAPAARLVFVDYLTILSPRGVCSALPLSEAQADIGRAIAKRLDALTARVAADTRSGLFKASAASREHSSCATAPWINGFPMPGGPGFVPYHPNARGMAVIADGLAARLSLGNL